MYVNNCHDNHDKEPHYQDKRFCIANAALELIIISKKPSVDFVIQFIVLVTVKSSLCCIVNNMVNSDFKFIDMSFLSHLT